MLSLATTPWIGMSTSYKNHCNPANPKRPTRKIRLP